MMLGIKWRVALYKGKAFKELNDGQFGYAQDKMQWTSVFIEELQFDVSRASRKMLVQTIFDATSCYDRIIPNLAMAAGQSEI
jgi:hypothetical protein